MPIETIIEKRDEHAAPAGISSGEEAQILTDSGFYWRSSGGIKVLCCGALEAAGFVNAFSTRGGGVSPFPHQDLNLAGFSEDTAENIYENRRRFLDLFEYEYPIALVWQEHGISVHLVDSLSEATDSNVHADAVISKLPGLLAGIKTADCVPVLIGDPVTGAFAAVHAGWRSTVASIAAKVVAEMASRFGTDPSDVVAAIGPAACGVDYEVGADVIDAFARNFADHEKYFHPTRPQHALVDLHAANRDQLISRGVSPANIFTAPLCTISRTDLFFSYRIEKKKNGKTGRSLSVIGRGRFGAS